MKTNRIVMQGCQNLFNNLAMFLVCACFGDWLAIWKTSAYPTLGGDTEKNDNYCYFCLSVDMDSYIRSM